MTTKTLREPLTPRTVYHSKTYGPLTFVGMDVYFGESSYHFKEGRSDRYLLPQVMADEFPSLATPPASPVQAKAEQMECWDCERMHIAGMGKCPHCGAASRPAATEANSEASEFQGVAVGEGLALMSMMRDDVTVVAFRDALTAYARAVTLDARQPVAAPSDPIAYGNINDLRNMPIATTVAKKSSSYFSTPLFSAAPVAQGEALTELDQENLRVGRELQRAAGFLPDDCYLEVNIERGYGNATLFDIHGTCVANFDAANSDGMSYAISKAIDAAILAKRAGSADHG